MSGRQAFMRAIREKSEDDAPRLIFADWLDENDHDAGSGECQNPNCARGFARIGMYGSVWKNCPDCRGSGRLANAFAEQAEFIRVQIQMHLLNPAHHKTRCRCKGCKLRLRETALWNRLVYAKAVSVGLAGWVSYCRESGVVHRGLGRCEVWYERGFPAGVYCSADAWINHGDALVAEHPIRVVRLTTWPEQADWSQGGLIYPGDDTLKNDRWPGVTFHLPVLRMTYPANALNDAARDNPRGPVRIAHPALTRPESASSSKGS